MKLVREFREFLNEWIFLFELVAVVWVTATFWFASVDTFDAWQVPIAFGLPLTIMLVAAFFANPDARNRYGMVLALFGIPSFFAALYLTKGPFDCLSGPIDDEAFDYLYFSFTTYTGLGYGDIAPTNKICRLLTTANVVCGHVSLAYIAALFFAKFTVENGRQDP